MKAPHLSPRPSPQWAPRLSPRLSPYLLVCLLPFVSGAAFADDAAILKCRALGNTATRLLCYDAIAVGAAAAPATAAVPSTAAATAQQRFGIDPEKQQPELPRSVESTIPGSFDGWSPGAQIKLANGQVWRVIDGSEAVLAPMSNPKVKVVRNMLGTLFMKIEGTNNAPKVRRIE